MLKKSMKAVLTVAAIASVSTVAMAEAKISGSAAAYFGQNDTGVEGAAARLVTRSEANVWLKGSKGNMSYAFEYEQREESAESTHTAADNRGRAYLTYKMDKLSFSIGELTTGVQPSIVAGTKTSQTAALGVYLGTNTYRQSQGAGLSFAIQDGMTAGLTLYTDDGTGSEGQAYVGWFKGKFGDISARASLLSGSGEDFDVDTDEAKARSNMLLGATIGLGEGMSIAVDSASNSQTQSDDTKNSKSDLALMFSMGLGDATVKATFATRETKVSDEKSSSNTFLTGVYDAKVSDGAGIQAVYASNATKTESTGETVTETFLGAGFYSSF